MWSLTRLWNFCAPLVVQRGHNGVGEDSLFPERSIISAVQGCIRAVLQENIEISRNPAEKVILMVAFGCCDLRVVWPFVSQGGGLELCLPSLNHSALD